MSNQTAERTERVPSTIVPLAESRPVLPPLPAPLTRLIGRTGEIERIRAHLRDAAVRLVTLTGPGGVGKTRLALEIAAGERRAGATVGFLSLATVDTPDLVLAAIAGLLRIRLGGDRPAVERLAGAIGAWPLLLLLDNLEQVPGAGSILADLLRACPHMTILATSRERLRVSGERVVTVVPLSCPDPDHLPPLDQVAVHDAIGLFVERAQAANDRFVLTADNVADVVRLCRRLDGLPLAIELAASRSNVLSPRALLERTDQRLALLRGGLRDQPSRLQTMRSAIGWSYDLLSPEEQALFRRLAVFAGGFSIAGAEAVRRATRDERHETRGAGRENGDLALDARLSTLDLLESLVDKSLIRAAGDDGETRFEMLETIREYGLERLAEAGEEQAARDAHVTYFVALAERAEPEFGGPRQEAWFARFETEHANVRAAIDWLLVQRDAERGLRLCNALAWFWSSRGHHREGRAWLETFLAFPAADGAADLGIRGLLMAANHAQWEGDCPKANAFFERALAACLRRGDRFNAALAQRGLASVAIDLREPERAEALIHASLPTFRDLGTGWDQAFATLLLGRVAHLRGDPTAATDRFAAAADLFGEVGDRDYQMAALSDLANVALLSGAVGRFRTAHESSLALAASRDDEWVTARLLVSCAWLACLDDDPAGAARFLAAAEYWRDEFSTQFDPVTASAHAYVAEAVRERLGADAIAAVHRAAGRRVLEQAIAAIRPPQPSPPSEHVAAVRSTVDGSGHGITARESEVLRLLIEGLTDKEIAGRLGISRRTVSKHVQTILAKLDAPTRTAAATYASRHGIV